MKKEVFMYFCERCNYLMQDTICSNCGKKNLREVKDDDFCYFLTMNPLNAQMFEGNLKEKNIPVAMLGVGIDPVMKTSRNFNVFIPYKDLEKTTQLYKLMFGKLPK